MPEGHTVHRAARLQAELLCGRRLTVDSPQGRFDEGAALLDGRTLEAIDAYGKHLFYRFSGAIELHVHLGLYGKFRSGLVADGVPPRSTARVRFVAGDRWLTLSGPTACDIIDASERRAILARIGPDPLRADARPAPFAARVAKSRVAIGALLMDQSAIAGIGNVYRAEILFRAKLHPLIPGTAVSPAAVRAVWRDARTLLRAGESSGRIVTTRPADRPHPAGAVRRGEAYYVYHRTGRPCFICETPIATAPLAARTVYWCPHCQPHG